MTKRWSAVTRAMWTDERFLNLTSPQPNAQTLWLYLLTTPYQIPIPGLLPLGPGAIADDLGWDTSDVRTHLAELEEAEMIMICRRPALIFLPRAIHHNQPANPNMIKGWRNGFDNLPECVLRGDALTLLREGLKPSLLPAFDKIFASAAKQATTRIAAKPTPEKKAKLNGSANGMRNQDQEQELINKSVRAKLRTPRKVGRPKTEPSPDAAGLAEYLLTQIATHSPDYAEGKRQTAVKTWALHFDYLLRLDKADPHEVRTVIHWAHVDDKTGFWQGNLLSASSVRKQFPRLRIQVKRAGLIHDLKDESSWKEQFGEWAVRLAERTRITTGDLDGQGLIASARLEGVPAPTLKDAESIASWALGRV